MQVETTSSTVGLIPQEALRTLQQRSDARGLGRLAGHLAAIGVSGFVYALVLQQATGALRMVFVALAATALGFTLVTMFAAMHEAVHRTAFKSLWLNNAVGWFAGLLSFYNSTFYRHYHGFHHRFTQIPGKDPELGDKKPTTLFEYAVELSGVTWWIGKLKTHFSIALGRVAAHPYLNAKNTREVVRSVRLQLLTYGAAITASVALGHPYFALYWLLPVALGQPLLRAILLAEHTGCSQDDNALSNTRTTYTTWPIRFLMWEMPYHAEHHRHPALPFFALRQAHELLGPHLVHVARNGYSGMHAELLARLMKSSENGVQA